MLVMDVTLGYAIATGGVLLILVLINLLPCLPYLVSFAPPFFYQALKYLTYPYFVRRHRFLGPWTLADVIIQLVYIMSNSLCLGVQVSSLGFQVSSIARAGFKAGNLSLINLILLFLGPHLSFLADILGVSLSTIQRIHRSAGLMSLGLALFHVLVIVASSAAFTLSSAKNLSAVVAGSSLGLIVALSWPPLRRGFYEIFLRLHQIMAVVIAISVLLHVPSTIIPRLYLYVAAGIFIVTSAVEGVIFPYHCGIFAYGKDKKVPRIGEIFKYPGEDDGPVQVTILPKEPLKMKAGQYINICIPSLSVWSFMQSHPFVVTSWTGKQQTKLELIIEPRRGWTKKLRSRAITASGQSGGLGRVLFTGPHGVPVPVDEYEYIFMVVSGYGIIAHLPLLERLVQGTLAREVRARRICLVWEFDDIGLYKAVYPLFNWVLIEDRKLGNNCALAITLYSKRLSPAKLSQRAQILREQSIPLEGVFENEIKEIDSRKRQEEEAVKIMEKKRADEKEIGREEIIYGRMEQPNKENESVKLPVCTRSPRMLITVSASVKIRDDLRSVLQTSLNKEITLVELDYQPQD